MKDYKKYINALRACAKEHKNDLTPFAHIIVSDLCKDTADLLEELEQDTVLDNIRTEIESQRKEASDKNPEDDKLLAYYCGLNDGLKDARDILDKYKAESEDNE